MLIASGVEKELGRRRAKGILFARRQEVDPHEGKEGNPCHTVPSDFVMVGLLKCPVDIEIIRDQIASRPAEAREEKAGDER